MTACLVRVILTLRGLLKALYLISTSGSLLPVYSRRQMQTSKQGRQPNSRAQTALPLVAWTHLQADPAGLLTAESGQTGQQLPHTAIAVLALGLPQSMG